MAAKTTQEIKMTVAFIGSEFHYRFTLGVWEGKEGPQKLLRQDATRPPVRASGVFKDYWR